jgi:hypothetical protein
VLFLLGLLGGAIYLGYYFHKSKIAQDAVEAVENFKDDRANQVLSSAQEAKNRNAYFESWEILRKYNETDPGNSKVIDLMATLKKEPVELAQKQIAHGQLESACKILTEVVKYNPTPELQATLKRSGYDYYLKKAKEESKRAIATDCNQNTGSYAGIRNNINLHNWKGAIKAYDSAIQISDTQEARKGRATAVEMLTLEEVTLLTQLQKNIDAMAYLGTMDEMTQQVEKLNSLKEYLAAVDRLEAMIGQLKTALVGAKRIAALEEEVKLARLQGRKQDVPHLLQNLLNELNPQSRLYYRYSNELRQINPIYLAQKDANISSQIASRRSNWLITPASGEVASADGAVGLATTSVTCGYDAAKRLAANGANFGRRGGRVEKYEPQEYLEDVLNKNLELILVEVAVRNGSSQPLNIGRSSFKFLDGSGSESECAFLSESGVKSLGETLVVEASQKKSMFALFMPSQSGKPEGIKFVPQDNKKAEITAPFAGVKIAAGAE